MSFHLLFFRSNEHTNIFLSRYAIQVKILWLFEVVTQKEPQEKSPISAINKIKKHSTIHRQSSRYSFLFSGDENCVKPREEGKKIEKKENSAWWWRWWKKKEKGWSSFHKKHTEKKEKSMPSYAAAFFSLPLRMPHTFYNLLIK